MANFVYNNTKNANINHMFFKFNYSYYLRVFFKNNIDFYFKSHSTNKLTKKLRELIFANKIYFTFKNSRKKHIIKM